MAEELNTDLGALTDEQLEAALSDADFGTDDDSLDKTLVIGADEEDADESESVDADESDESVDESEEASDDKDEVKDDEADEADGEEDEEEKQDDDEEETAMDPGTRAQIQAVLESVEMLKAQNERLQSEVERERLLRDRNAGKLGSLMQQLKKGSADADGAEDLDDVDDVDDTPPKSKKNSEVSDELQEIRVERVNRAISGVSQEFLSDNSTFFGALEKEAGAEAAQKFHSDLVAKIKSHQDSLGEDIFTMSPKLAAKVAKTVIQSAFADVKLDLMREYQKRAAEKSEESRRNIRARKKGASGARNNKRAAVAQPKTKSLSNMSDAELEKALASASFDD